MEQGVKEEKKVRRGSTEDIEELLNRKRERIEKEKKVALEEETFRKNKKVVKSSMDKNR